MLKSADFSFPKCRSILSSVKLRAFAKRPFGNKCNDVGLSRQRGATISAWKGRDMVFEPALKQDF